ncbi:MAG: hypothetical protein M1608_15795 [Candidatus Omnitrophica bacterium]|nr:hypothetical protein [Candidatus Omnitrophota bacterium]
MTSNGNLDAFIAKYNQTGALQWVQGAGGPGEDGGADVCLCPSQNPHIVGWFQGQATLGGTTLTGSSLREIFVAKLTTAGAAPPAILSLSIVNQCANLSCSAPVGSNLRIECTSNLQNPNGWITLTNLTVASDPFVFVDQSSSGATTRFYRAAVAGQ